MGHVLGDEHERPLPIREHIQRRHFQMERLQSRKNVQHVQKLQKFQRGSLPLASGARRGYELHVLQRENIQSKRSKLERRESHGYELNVLHLKNHKSKSPHFAININSVLLLFPIHLFFLKEQQEKNADWEEQGWRGICNNSTCIPPGTKLSHTAL